MHIHSPFDVNVAEYLRLKRIQPKMVCLIICGMFDVLVYLRTYIHSFALNLLFSLPHSSEFFNLSTLF